MVKKIEDKNVEALKAVAVIRLAGQITLTKEIKDTFNMLRLYKKNSCIIIPNTKEYQGMIMKVKDGITWGEVNADAIELLLKERGKLAMNMNLTDEWLKDKMKSNMKDVASKVHSCELKLKDIPGMKPFFKLNPPRGGFERKGTKKLYHEGGALGYRKDNINELIKKMI